MKNMTFDEAIKIRFNKESLALICIRREGEGFTLSPSDLKLWLEIYVRAMITNDVTILQNMNVHIKTSVLEYFLMEGFPN